MKRALVLAGGGARGAYQVGMLRELIYNRKLDFQIIRGVSVGALNAAFLAQAPTGENSHENLEKKVEELSQVWIAEIKGNQSVYKDKSEALGLLEIAAGADSLYDLDPLQNLLKKHLSPEALRNSGRDFKVGTVSLVTGEYKEWGTSDPRFIDRILASASIPVVFPFVRFKEESDVLVDGGARNITPLSSAFRAGAEEIYVLLTSRLLPKGRALVQSSVKADTYQKWDDNWLGTKVSGIDVLKRAVDILTDEVYLNDLDGALDWNTVALSIKEVVEQAARFDNIPGELAAAIEKLGRSITEVNKRPVKIYVLAPQEWFGEENSATEFSPPLIRQAIQHGEAIAQDVRRWLWPEPEITVMPT